jgi:predicted nucleic acid-binding Zn ribbon protein
MSDKKSCPVCGVDLEFATDTYCGGTCADIAEMRRTDREELKQIVVTAMKEVFAQVARGIRAKRKSITDFDPGYSGSDADHARAEAENSAKDAIRQSMDDIADVLEDAART